MITETAKAGPSKEKRSFEKKGLLLRNIPWNFGSKQQGVI